MRVCHVSPHLPPDQAANALLPAHLGAWSSARGDSVSFVTQPPAQGGAPIDQLAGPVVRVAARSSSRWSRLLRIDTLRRTRSIVAGLDRMASKADLLHLHSNGLIVEVAAAWASRRRAPYILTLYGTEVWHYRRRWPIDPFRRAFAGARAVTFYSRKLLERAVAAGLEHPHMVVIYPTIAPAFRTVDDVTREDWRRRLGIQENRVVLNVKRLHPLAAQNDLIVAFAQVARGRGDVRLVICGTGPLASDLKDLAARSGVAEKITFAGLVSNDDVARYAAVADVFALPSRLEALPTVAVEALAAGTPVVSADHPGGIELHALFGEDVAVVPRGDVGALAATLSARIAAPRRTQADTAEVVERHFGRAAVESAYDRLYQQAIL